MITHLIFAAAVTATSTAAAFSVGVSDPCDRHAQIVAIRGGAQLRKELDAEVLAAKGRAKGCAAAVAAEAALHDGDKARTRELLAIVAAELPALSTSIAPHRALLAAELGQADETAQLLEQVSPRATEWRARIALAQAQQQKDAATATTLLSKLAAKDAASRSRDDDCDQ